MMNYKDKCPTCNGFKRKGAKTCMRCYLATIRKGKKVCPECGKPIKKSCRSCRMKKLNTARRNQPAKKRHYDVNPHTNRKPIKFYCPKCKAEILPENINGLYYKCAQCGFLDDSSFNMFLYARKVRGKPLIAEKT